MAKVASVLTRSATRKRWSGSRPHSKSASKFSPFAFTGTRLHFRCGARLSGVLSIRSRTSSVVGVFVDMPQPLIAIRPPPYTVDFTRGAAQKAAALAALAVDAIGASAKADADFMRLVGSFTHGRIAPV